ncbi:MAG: hypothetical protein IT427_18480 [Pirellulales bacterium]|nr:hypothetical protein [Pirellulales bacterium]
MWRLRLGHFNSIHQGRLLACAKQVGFETLEPRLAMTWGGVPPIVITPPTNATTVALDAQGDASGSAAIGDSEVDYYSFLAPATGAYALAVSTPAFSQLDTVLGVFSSSGQRIAYNDDVSMVDRDSQLSVELTAGARYYVGITNYDSSEQGSYAWSINGPAGSITPTIDLSGAALSASDAGGWGKTITVQAEVQNTGNTDSGTFLVRWYLARDSQAQSGRVSLQRIDAPRSSVRIENIAAGGSITIDVTLKLPSKARTGWHGSSFYLVMGTDVGREVVETNEANNLGQVGAGFDYDPITIGASGGSSAGSFNIQLDMSGLTSSQRDIFQRAADRWEQAIIGDLPQASYGGRTIDDLQISASARSMDGVNGILGQAGPDAFRPGSDLPFHGVMQFDSADLSSMQRSGLLLSVVMHEMGHVLGIGTIWEDLGLLSGAGDSNPIFTGSRATAAYNSLFGLNAGGVPVENTGGAGTADAHWRESVFSSELMTGWAGPGANLPLSRITIASLADLGYRVNMAAANSFTPSASGRSAARQAGGSGRASLVAAADEFAAVVVDAAPPRIWRSTPSAGISTWTHPAPRHLAMTSSTADFQSLAAPLVDASLGDAVDHKDELESDATEMFATLRLQPLL